MGLEIEDTRDGSPTRGGGLRLSSNTDGDPVGVGDRLGVIDFAGDETEFMDTFVVGARIEAIAAVDWTTSQNGTNLDFYTTDGDAVETKRLTILAGGNVGIGTDSPDDLLELSSNSYTTQYISSYHNDEAVSPSVRFRKADNTEASPQLVDNNAVLGDIRFQGYDGDEFINGARILAKINGSPADGLMPCDLEFYTNLGAYLGGSVTLNAYLAKSGDWYTNDGTVSSISSDERLKKDIRDFSHGLSVVNQLNPVYYKFNGKNGRNEDVEDRIGMLANVVKDIAPDITETKMGELDGVETELWTMSYDKLIFYVVNAIQELSAKVTALENQQ
jgi:hypothetical protein